MDQIRTQTSHHFTVAIAAEDASQSSPLCQALIEKGFTVRTFNRACEASRQLSNESFHCLIVDCLLKSGTAEQIIVAARRQKSSANTQTPIVLLSRNFDTDLLKRYQSDVSDTFRKPLDLSALIEKITYLCLSSSEAAA